jgi:putative spermidine/putrescine transport system ATP-binding protein
MTRSMTPYIQFKQVSKSFGSVRVVEHLDFDIAHGEFVSLLGPSGSGKTTILMMLAGFEAPSSGTIHVADRRIDQLPPHKRDMGVVFQNFALFPHRSVAENVAFPLQMRGMDRGKIAPKVARALEMVKLGHLGDRRPAQLSGGQQQRVALARALVFEPEVVLMDEPLGALDKQLREHMQLELRDLHRTLGLTVIFVTHDQSEALTMSDRVAVFNNGRVEQIGTPQQIYDAPQTRFVAEFVGETNLIEAQIDTVDQGGARVRAGGLAFLVDEAAGRRPGEAINLSLRPERIRLGDDPSVGNALPAQIADWVYQGDHVRVHLQAGELSLVAKLDRRAREWPVGSAVIASFEPDDCRVVPA